MNTIERILLLINKHNITAKKLTNDLELSNSAITDWKKGKGRPSIDAIIKISKYFNVTSDWLLTGEKNLTQLDNLIINESTSKQKFEYHQNSFSPDQQELLDLYNQLDPIKQAEFKGELKGYLKAKNNN